MKLYQTTVSKQIALSVCLLHLLILLCLSGHHWITHKLRPTKPMIVKTIIPITPAASVPQRIEAPKKTAPKPLATPATPTKKIAAPAVSNKKVATNHFKEIAEELEKFNSEAKPSSRPALKLPTKIESKKGEVPVKETVSYEQSLIAFLQSELNLPEYGQVRLEIEIDRFGNLIDCRVLQSKSAKNAEFLKNQLPELTFPCLNDFGISNATQTFTIAFSNAT